MNKFENISLLPHYAQIFGIGPLTERLKARTEASPVAVGGVGGSGTRAIAEALSAFGMHQPGFVTQAQDNLSFPPLGQILRSPCGRAGPRDAVASYAIRLFEDFVREDPKDTRRPGSWFFKVPAVFFWLKEFEDYFPAFRYIHVMRNGIDMACSRNRRQAETWRYYFGIGGDLIPRRMLDYWIAANRFALAQAEEWLPGRYYVLRFDDLCLNPTIELGRLADFLEIQMNEDLLAKAASAIRPPASIGRGSALLEQNEFSAEQLDAVSNLGFRC